MGFWQATADLKLIPASGIIREIPKRGYELQDVEEAERNFPGLAMRLGQFVRFHGVLHRPTGVYEYGLMVSPNWPSASLGLMQIDHHLGMLVAYSYLGLWLASHPKTEVLLHPALRRYLVGFNPLERVSYGK